MKPACLTCGYPRFRPEGHAVWCAPHNAREEAAHGHPSLNCYSLHGCRCDRCSAAEATHLAEREARKAARPVAPHPSLNWYTNKGCRCDECRQLMRAYNQRRRSRDRLTVASSLSSAVPAGRVEGSENGAVT